MFLFYTCKSFCAIYRTPQDTVPGAQFDKNPHRTGEHAPIAGLPNNACNEQEPVAETLEELWISYNNIEKLKGITVLANLRVRIKFVIWNMLSLHDAGTLRYSICLTTVLKIGQNSRSWLSSRNSKTFCL